MKNKTSKELKFYKSVAEAVRNLSSYSKYAEFKDKRYSMYQIPRGELLGITYVPSKLYKGKQITFIDKDDKEISVNVSLEKENAIWEIFLGIDKNYSKLIEEDMSKVTLWFIMGGGNKEQALCEVDTAAPFMVLLGIRWDEKWLYHDKHRSKTMSQETLNSINKQRIFYLDQFVYHGKPGTFNLTYPNIAEDEVRQYLLTDKISKTVTGTPSTSAGYAVLCVPEAPYFFQRPMEYSFIITHTSSTLLRHGKPRSIKAQI